MPTEVIDGNSIRKAINAVEARQNLIIRDSLAPGLAIRVQRGSASWYLITRDTKRPIAALGIFGKADIPFLREIVGKARVMLSEGQDPRSLFAAAVVERDVDAAGHRSDAADGRVMTWEMLRDAYLGWASKNRSFDTHRGYRSALGAIPGSPLVDDFASLKGKPATAIVTHDLRLVRNRILKRGQDEDGKQISHTRQAGLTVDAIKAAFKWSVENYEITGLTTNPATELNPPGKQRINVYDEDEDDDEKKSKARRALTLLEIGKLIYGLEKWPNNPARLALMLQLLTGQRRTTIVRARKKGFLETTTHGMIWEIGPDKSGKYRRLPLPDFAADTVRHAMNAGQADSIWLFPQQRLRRKGDSGKGHMSERMLNEIMEEYRKKGGPLETVPWASTHDLRRAFVTHMNRRLEPLGLPRGSVSMITRGDEGRVGLDEETYDLDPLLDDKWSLMCDWDQHIRRGCQQAEALGK